MSLPFPFFVFVPPPLMRPTESAMRHVPGFDPGWRPTEEGVFVPPRHHMAPPQGACGRGCAPVPNPIWGRGLSERSACPEQREGTLNQQSTVWKSRFLVSLGMTTERHRMGPRPGAHGFGSFCRNKRISPCGGETPQTLPLSPNRKRDSETGRAGPGPAREFHAPLEIHARSRGAHVGAGSL